MRKRDVLPHEARSPALVELLALRFMVFLAHVFSEVSVYPVREDILAQGLDLPVLERLVRLQHTLAHRQQFSPDQQADAVRIDRNADLLGSSRARNEVALSDDRLPVLHQVFEHVRLAELRHPRRAVRFCLEAVLAVPLRLQDCPLGADRRAVAQMLVEELP